MGNESSRPKLDQESLEKAKKEFESGCHVDDVPTTLRKYNLRPRFYKQDVYPICEDWLRSYPRSYDRKLGVRTNKRFPAVPPPDIPYPYHSDSDAASFDNLACPKTQRYYDRKEAYNRGFKEVVETYHSLVYELEMELEYLSKSFHFAKKEKKGDRSYTTLYNKNNRFSESHKECRDCFKRLLDDPGVLKVVKIALERPQFDEFIPYYLAFIDKFTKSCRSVCEDGVFGPFYRLAMKFKNWGEEKSEDLSLKMDRLKKSREGLDPDESIQVESNSVLSLDESAGNEERNEERRIVSKRRASSKCMNKKMKLFLVMYIMLIVCGTFAGYFTPEEARKYVNKTNTAVYESYEKGNDIPILLQLEYVEDKIEEMKEETEIDVLDDDLQKEWGITKMNAIDMVTNTGTSILPTYSTMYDGLNVSNFIDLKGMDLVDSNSYTSPEGSNPGYSYNSQSWRSKDGTSVLNKETTFFNSLKRYKYNILG